MNRDRFQQIKGLFFTHRDVARLLGITKPSAKVACCRYVRAGILVRLKRDCYLLKERWQRLSREEQFTLANQLQVPSYVSLTSALSFDGYTTQTQQNFVESVALKRTQEINIEGITFCFKKIKKEFYAGFEKREGFFIAGRQKAFLDALYLASFGRYHLDCDAVEWQKLDRKKIDSWIKKYPQRTRRYWRNHAGINRTGTV